MNSYEDIDGDDASVEDVKEVELGDEVDIDEDEAEVSEDK